MGDCPGRGCLTYKLSEADEKKLQRAVTRLEKLCKELVVPAMCVIQVSNNNRHYGTISFSNQVTAKSDLTVDAMVKLEHLFWGFEDCLNREDVADIWEHVDDLHQILKERN